MRNAPLISHNSAEAEIARCCYLVTKQCLTLWDPTRLLQHTRLLCPSLSSGVCSDSCPLSQWCHPTVSSSAVPFYFCLQSFPASGSFPMSWLFASGGRNIGASASASVLPMNIQDWFPLGWTGLISLQSKESLLQHHSSETSILQCSAFFMVQLLHLYMTTGKTIRKNKFDFMIFSFVFKDKCQSQLLAVTWNVGSWFQ